MDSTHYEDRDGGFRALDLSARLAFRSDTSISFHLGRYPDRLVLPGGDLLDGDFAADVGAGGVFVVAGRVDVHHPREGHIKAQLQAIVPAEYHSFERMREFVATVFEALGIPADETFEASFIHPERQTRYENDTDREGMTDRI